MVSSGGRLSPVHDFPTHLARVMGRLARDRVVDRSFADALRANRRHLSAVDRALAIQFVEGFEAADTTEISERALADGGTPGSDDVREARIGRLVGGYGPFIDSLADSVRSRIRLGAVASTVRWQRGHVDVHCRDLAGASSMTLSARAAIITAPIGVLGASAGTPGAIAFDPPVPSIDRAVALMAMGHVVRLTLRFDHPFWMNRGIAERLRCPQLDQVSFIHARRRLPFPVWWTTYPVRSPLLVAWVGGPGASAMSRLSPAEIEAQAVASLARLLSTTTRSIRAMLVASFHHDWVNDPFARGVYSYSRVGRLRRAARPREAGSWHDLVRWRSHGQPRRHWHGARRARLGAARGAADSAPAWHGAPQILAICSRP